MRTGRLHKSRTVTLYERHKPLLALYSLLGLCGLDGGDLSLCGLCGNLRSLQVCLLAANDGGYFTGCVHGCLQAAVSLDAPGAISLDCDLAVCVLAAPGTVSLYSYLTFVTLNGPAAVLRDNDVALYGCGGGVTLGVLGLSLGALFVGLYLGGVALGVLSVYGCLAVCADLDVCGVTLRR